MPITTKLFPLFLPVTTEQGKANTLKGLTIEFSITGAIMVLFQILSSAHAHKYKTKRQIKMNRRENKMTFLMVSHQSTFVPK